VDLIEFNEILINLAVASWPPAESQTRSTGARGGAQMEEPFSPIG